MVGGRYPQASEGLRGSKPTPPASYTFSITTMYEKPDHSMSPCSEHLLLSLLAWLGSSASGRGYSLA